MAPTRKKDPDRCQGRCWLVLGDACGIVCVGVTYIITLASVILADLTILLPRIMDQGGLFGNGSLIGVFGLPSFVHFVGYNLAVFVMLLSQLLCMCSNPGTASDYLEPELVSAMQYEFARLLSEATDKDVLHGNGNEIWPARMGRKWWCQKCDTYRPRHTHHCSTCGSCVLEMDHHCPWVNNCVGWRNHKYFFLFINYAWLSCIWTVSIVLRALLTKGLGSAAQRLQQERTIQNGVPKPMSSWPSTPTYVLRSESFHDNVAIQLVAIFDCVVCFLLTIFTCVMAFDQWEYMAEGLGTIDRKQRANGVGVEEETRGSISRAKVPSCRRCSCDNLPHIMGEKFGWRWWLPVSPKNKIKAVLVEDDMISAARERYKNRDSDLPEDWLQRCRAKRASERSTSPSTKAEMTLSRSFRGLRPPVSPKTQRLLENRPSTTYTYPHDLSELRNRRNGDTHTYSSTSAWMMADWEDDDDDCISGDDGNSSGDMRAQEPSSHNHSKSRNLSRARANEYAETYSDSDSSDW